MHVCRCNIHTFADSVPHKLQQFLHSFHYDYYYFFFFFFFYYYYYYYYYYYFYYFYYY